MEDNKKLPVKLSTVFLIIAIIAILIMVCAIFLLARNKTVANQEIAELKAENEKLQTTISSMQEQINSLNAIKTNIEKVISNSTATTTQNNNTNTIQANSTQKTEEDKMKEVANAFVKAVNEKDYTTAEKYSNSNVVTDLKKYNVYNMTVDTTTFEKNPNNANSYYCYSSYEIDYNGQSRADVGLGRIFNLEKSGEIFKVTAFGATGL